MLKNLYDKNIIIYSFMVLCGLGLLIRITVNLVYKHLIKESDRLGETKNKMLMHMKMKFTTCYKLKIGVNNVDTFVDKNVLKYRFCGLLLSTWDNACGQVLFLNLLAVPILAVFSVFYDCGQDQILLGGAVGILTSAIMILVDKSINLPAKRKLLRLNLLDYLENFCKVRLEQEASHPELVEQYRKEYLQAMEAVKQTGAAVAAKENPKDELNRRREARLKKEEEKKLLATKREEEQKKLMEARREEERRKLEERRQQAAKRREEERQKLEEERAALEARREELKRKAAEKQLANEQKQQKAEEKDRILHRLEADLKKPDEAKSSMNALMKELEEITAEKEQTAAAKPKTLPMEDESAAKENGIKEKAMKEETVKENAVKETAAKETVVKENAVKDNMAKVSPMKEKQQKAAAKNTKTREITIQEEKLIEDVLKEFFA